MRLQKNSVSLAGEFAVLSQLSLRGIDANLTLGNTKGVDILATNPETDKLFRIEVKSSISEKPSNSDLLGNSYKWVVSEKNETLISKNLIYCFVNNINLNAEPMRFFVVPSKVVAEYVRTSHQYWLKSKGNSVKDTSIRNFRLGFRDEKYDIKTPVVEEYENKWELIR